MHKDTVQSYLLDKKSTSSGEWKKCNFSGFFEKYKRPPTNQPTNQPSNRLTNQQLDMMKVFFMKVTLPITMANIRKVQNIKGTTKIFFNVL